MSKRIDERIFPPQHRLFARALFAQTQARVRRQGVETFLDPRNAISREILARANAAHGTTTTAGWAAEIVQESFGAFLTSLAPYSAGAHLIDLALKGDLPPGTAQKFPVRAAGPASSAWVGEGDPIPVHSAVTSNVTLGPAKKIGHLLVWSLELSKRSDADAIFEQMLREDAAAGLDAAMFATSAGSSAAVAGLLNGVTATTASTATGKLGLVEDLTALAAAAATGGSGRIVFAMAPERLAMARVIAPEIIASSDVVASAAIPTTRVVAVDPLALLVSIAGPDIEIGPHSTLHLSDVPLEIVSDTGPTTADPVRSVWQTATVALRLLYELAFVKRRSTAAAYLDGAGWQ